MKKMFVLFWLLLSVFAFGQNKLEEVNYFPLTLKNEWRYTFPRGEAQLKYRVAYYFDDIDVYILTTLKRFGSGNAIPYYYTYEIKVDGVYETGCNSDLDENWLRYNVCKIKYPIKNGDKWESTTKTSKYVYPNMSQNSNKGNVYLLTKNKDVQLVCGYCGSSVKTMLSKTSDYYYCSNKDCTGKHAHKQKVVDDKVLKELDFVINNIDKYKILIDDKYQVNLDKAMQLISKKRENIIKTAELLKDVNLDEYNILIQQINNIANYGNEIISDLMTKYEFKIKQKEIYIYSVELNNQKEILNGFIEKIVLYVDAMEIYFRFPIDTDLNSVVTISMLSSDKDNS